MRNKSTIRFLNTLGRELQDFISIDQKKVGMYTCGPTVYGRAHLGNMRAYIFADIVRRVLEYGGYEVKQVMNITDVGHLTSNADDGEDKLQKAAKEQKKTAWDISKLHTQQFFEDTAKLNIQPVHIACKATDHVEEQIALIKRLEDNGFAYITSDGIYYDTSKCVGYGKLAKLNIKGLQAGHRIEMGEKRNKTDFALWKFSKLGESRDMEWNSPWGKGFPGWHVECSAMSIKYLGETFDIHTGGIDHIPIHHTNEIAQSEGATGRAFVNYWLHSDFLVMSDKEKMSKSLGNVIDVETIEESGIEPLAFRYLCLGAHYRKRILFGKEILQNASNAFSRLKKNVIKLKEVVDDAQLNQRDKVLEEKYLNEFKGNVFNDLNTPRGLATMWDMLGDNNLPNINKYGLLLEFDNVFALDLSKMKEDILDVPKEISKLLKQRTQAKNDKKWTKADDLRDKILNAGFFIEDTPKGAKLRKCK